MVLFITCENTCHIWKKTWNCALVPNLKNTKIFVVENSQYIVRSMHSNVLEIPDFVIIWLIDVRTCAIINCSWQTKTKKLTLMHTKIPTLTISHWHKYVTQYNKRYILSEQSWWIYIKHLVYFWICLIIPNS